MSLRLLDQVDPALETPLAVQFVEHVCEQRTPEWFAARLGRLTGSRAADAFASPLKNGGEPAARRNLRIQLVLERLTNGSQESGYCSPAMQQGIDREGAARAAYEAMTGEVVQTSGFLAHPSLMAGTSLDGHLGAYAALVEIKCPLPATHLGYLQSGQVPEAYLVQVRHALWLTGAAWCDWVSYCPDFPEALHLKVVRVTATPAELASHELLVRGFLRDVDREYAAVRALAGDPREPGDDD